MRNVLIIILALTTLSLFGQSAELNGTYDRAALISLALSHSRELGILASRSEQSRQETKKARSARLPSLSASASYSYLGLPPRGVTLEAGELGTIDLDGPGPMGPILLPGEETVFLEDTGHNYFQAGLVLNQPLYTWGKLNGAVEAARGAERVDRAALSGGERKTETEIKILMTTLTLLYEMDDNLQTQQEIVPSLIKIVDESVDQGFLLRKDLLEVKILSQEVKTAHLEMKHRQQTLLNRLSRLTGLADLGENNLNLTGIPSPGEVTLFSETDLIQSLLENNNDLDQLRIAMEIREALTGISESGKSPLPDMGFRLELGFADDTLPFTNNEWSTGFTATASLSLQSTLFDGGRNRADWKADQAREEEARLVRASALEAEEA